MLERLSPFKHTQEPVDPDLISETFIKYLDGKRKEVVDQSKGKGRKKRLNVVAAKSISAEELQQVSLPSTSKDRNLPSASKGRNLPSTSEDRKEPKKEKAPSKMSTKREFYRVPEVRSVWGKSTQCSSQVSFLIV